MRLVLMPGPTSCAPSDAFVGCGTFDNTIEMTFEGTRYAFFDVVGRGAVSVGPPEGYALSGASVLMHEVDHWFRLQHLAYKPDLIPDFMQDTYKEKACVSALDIELIANMDDAQHARRLSQGAGLRRAKPSTPR